MYVCTRTNMRLYNCIFQSYVHCNPKYNVICTSVVNNWRYTFAVERTVNICKGTVSRILRRLLFYVYQPIDLFKGSHRQSKNFHLINWYFSKTVVWNLAYWYSFGQPKQKLWTKSRLRNMDLRTMHLWLGWYHR
jgi:hypothetical protein